MIARSAKKELLCRLARSETGASLVEFAILAPVMIFLLVGLVDVGRFTYYSILAANAARAGAAFGAQNITTINNTTSISAAALADGQSLSNWQTTSQCLASVNGGALGACPSGSSTVQSGTVYYVQVSTSGTFNTLVKYPGLANSVKVSGSATMRVASQ